MGFHTHPIVRTNYMNRKPLGKHLLVELSLWLDRGFGILSHVKLLTLNILILSNAN